MHITVKQKTKYYACMHQQKIKPSPTTTKEKPEATAKRSQPFPPVKVFLKAPITFMKKNKADKFKATRKKLNRRKTIWFNPSYCFSVKANEGRTFLQIIKKTFSQMSKLHFQQRHIFIKNTIKVSNSYMGNSLSILSSHNGNILNLLSNTEYSYKCRFKKSYLLQNKFLTPAIM